MVMMFLGSICNKKKNHCLFLSVSVLCATCSSIHDHTDSHCFLKLLQGQLKETLFEWPDGKAHDEMIQKSQHILRENQCAYINGKIV